MIHYLMWSHAPGRDGLVPAWTSFRVQGRGCCHLRRDMAGKAPRSEPVTVILPSEPPELTPGAARVLLRILMKAHEKQLAEEREADAGSGTLGLSGG
jgi:hypothetical protein